MAERAQVFEYTQIGVESTSGTEVDANRVLEAYSFTPSREGDIEIFRPEGQKFGSLATVAKEHAVWNVDGILDYANIVYLLSSLINYAAPAQQLATAAYLWTFTPDTDGPDTVKTYTIEQGSSVRAHQNEYNQVTGFSFQFSGADSQIAVSASIIGQELRDGITKTGTPTTVSAVPCHPKQCAVKTAATQAGIAGASALTRVLNLEWHYNDKYAPVFVVNTDDSFTALVEQAADLGGSITLEADSTGMGYLATAQAGTQLWIEIKFTGAVIEGAYSYGITIQMPIHLISRGNIEDQDGVVAVTYDFGAVHDGTWGKALDLTVMNAVTAL